MIASSSLFCFPLFSPQMNDKTAQPPQLERIFLSFLFFAFRNNECHMAGETASVKGSRGQSRDVGKKDMWLK